MAAPPGPYDRFSHPTLSRSTPVLTRGPGTLQVGFDQEPTLLLVDVPPGLDRVLSMLDGCHSYQDIVATAAAMGLRSAQVDWVLRTLDQAGLLGQGETRTSPGAKALTTPRIRLVGAGRLGRAVAELLCRSRPVVLHVIDNQPADLTLYPNALGNQAEALAAALADVAQTSIRVANHWSKPEDVATDLTLVAVDRLECDRVLADDLVRADQPHLFLRARADGVLVGPLVLPGHTACLRCTDLARRDADPAWPTLLPQLLRWRPPVSEELIGWAGSVAAAQALGFLAGVRPETWGATLEITTTDYLCRRRSWSMHPGCGCGWGATAQWEA